MLALLDALAALLRRGERGALATVVRAAGSTPQEIGARMLLDAHGKLHGTVGGGRIEEQVHEALRRCLGGEPARVGSRTRRTPWRQAGSRDWGRPGAGSRAGARGRS